MPADSDPAHQHQQRRPQPRVHEMTPSCHITNVGSPHPARAVPQAPYGRMCRRRGPVPYSKDLRRLACNRCPRRTRAPTSHNFRTDLSQVRNHGFASQHTPEERSAPGVSREVKRLSTERYNPRQKVDRLAATNVGSKRHIGETRSAADRYQGRAMRPVQNERRHRRSRPPPHRDRGYPHLPPCYSPPLGRDPQPDNRRPPGRTPSSLSGHLQPPSSRQSAPPSRPPSSYQPTPTTSEPASSGQSSTFVPSSSAPPAGQRSAPIMDASSIVHGPEVTFDSGDEDNDEFNDIEARDAENGKQRVFKMRNHAMNRRHCEEMRAKAAPLGFDHSLPLPPPRSAPQWRPAQVPMVPADSTLNLPRVPGGQCEAYMGSWQHPTDGVLAGLWSDYLLLNDAQCNDLHRSARTYNNSGAAQRVRDLLYQYDAHYEPRALGHIHKIKQVWSNPLRPRSIALTAAF